MGPLSVREYLRVSRDRTGEGKSPDQQHAENLAAITQQGWIFRPDAPYRDADRSASRYTKKQREGFQRLVDDLESGDFGADVLAVWESSRGSRRVREWADLIDLCAKNRVRIWVTTHGRLYDPRNSRDRRSLHEDAVDAEYESDKTSERLLRSVRASAERGVPHGKNLYGYVRVYDSQSRRLLRVEEHPEQAAVVREAANRVLNGDSFRAIARDFNTRGLPARRPSRVEQRSDLGWTAPAVKQMLTTVAYAGKREHKGEIVADAVWPALYDFSTWQKLQALMYPASRRRTNDWPAKHLLAGIAICAVCGGRLHVGRQNAGKKKLDSDGNPLPRQTYKTYVCDGASMRPGASDGSAFHVSMREELLDEIVVELLFERLERPEFLNRSEDEDGKADLERKALLAEIRGYEEYLEDVRAQAAVQMRFDLIVDQEARIVPQIEAARARLGKLSTLDPLVTRLVSEGGLRDRWADMKLPEKRRLIRAVLTPMVKPIGRGWRGKQGPNRDRVAFNWH
ncbi:recombinase family protein [Curtobacterium sp. BRD11]|uniref:recombinase family protein n=1 Tax=Curtobacterium sp. BRD11 TaxID=2962581 RepID=UPI0028812BCC|nr:recombinase family protein [Curtobacterium sp. BRD11]MDT0209022.1 recombinase family protein [Curtobacterium sp. BRD11]